MRTTPQSGGYALTRRRIARLCVRLLLVAGSMSGLMSWASTAAAAEMIAGHWRLNEALTNEVQPKLDTEESSSGGMHGPVITAGGMPVPGPGSSNPYPELGGASPDPKVMRCTELKLAPAGDVMQIEYLGVGTDRLRRGNDQGLVSKWKDDRLNTRYKTTTRTVSEEWELDDADRLVVTVKLDPNGGKAVTYKRVFDRVAP
jgi:hypothetical protein